MNTKKTLCLLLSAFTLSSHATLNYACELSDITKDGSRTKISNNKNNNQTIDGEFFAKIIIYEDENNKDHNNKTFNLVRKYIPSERHYEISVLNPNNTITNPIYYDSNNGLNFLRQISETYKLKEIHYKNILPNSTLMILPKQILEKYTQKPKIEKYASSPPSTDLTKYPSFEFKEENVMQLDSILKQLEIKIMCY